jgi:hypothetical protein
MDRKLATKNLRLALLVAAISAILFALTFVVAAAYIKA